MRHIVAGVGSLVIVLGAIGVAGRLGTPVLSPAAATDETTTVTQSDTPGDAHVPSAKPPGRSGDPEVPAAPAGSRLEARRLLAAHEFNALTRLIEAKQVAALADVRREDELARVLLTFDVADEAMTPQLDTWLAAQPKAWPVHLARAKHFIAVGFARRGGSYRSKTSAKQFAGLDEYLRRANSEVAETLRLAPDLIEAFKVQIGIAQAKGGPEDCLALGARALAVEPASARIRFALALCLLPRWGGSYQAIEALAKESHPFVAKNPRLAALDGFVDWDRGRLAEDAKQDTGINLLNAAIKTGEDAGFYESRARAFERRRRYSDALADLAQGLALLPEDPDMLAIRARVFSALGRHRDAADDARLVAELDPDNEKLAYFRSREAKDAITRSRSLVEQRDAAGAVARLDVALQINGDDAELRYWRGRALIQAQQYARALTDFEASIKLDPRFIDSYKNIDWLLGREQRWGEIITHWNAYIALEPLNGDAYLERAGTHHHNGNDVAALADAKKACSLGVQKGCEIVGRLR